MERAAFFQPSVRISFDKALNQSLIVLTEWFAFSHEPADCQIKGYARFVVEQRHQCEMDGGSLADHGVGWTALKEVEQHGLQAPHVDTVFLHENSHRGFESKLLSAIDGCEVFADIRRKLKARREIQGALCRGGSPRPKE